MSHSLFLFKSHGKHDQHTIVNIDDAAEAEQLVSEGKATRISLGEYKSFKQKAQQIHSDFLKAEKEIKESKNPLLQQHAVQVYELGNLQEKYKEESEAIQAEWEKYRAQQIELARTKAARATVKVSEQDRDTAEQVSNRLALQIAAAGPSNIGEVLTTARQDIGRLTDGQKVALQGKIAGILAGIEGAGPQKAALIDELQDVRNMDLLAVKAAEQLPSNATIEYQQLRVIRGWGNGTYEYKKPRSLQ